MITVKRKMPIAKILLLGAFSLFVDAPQAVETREEFEKKQVTSQPSLHDTIPQEVKKAEEVTKSQENPQETLHDAIFESYGLIKSNEKDEKLEILTIEDKKLTLPNFKKEVGLHVNHLKTIGRAWPEYVKRLIYGARNLQIAHIYLRHFSAELQEHFEKMTHIKESPIEDFTSQYLKKIQGTRWWDVYVSKYFPVQKAFEEALNTQFSLVQKIMADQEKCKIEGVEIITGWEKIPENEKDFGLNPSKDFNFRRNPFNDCTEFSKALFKERSYWPLLQRINQCIDNYNAIHRKATLGNKLYSFFTTGKFDVDEEMITLHSLDDYCASYGVASDIITMLIGKLSEQEPIFQATGILVRSQNRGDFSPIGPDGLPYKSDFYGMLSFPLVYLKNEGDDVLFKEVIEKIPNRMMQTAELESQFKNIKFKLVSQKSLIDLLRNFYLRQLFDYLENKR